MTTYASGKYALGLCDRCGRAFRLLELREETVAGQPANNRVCWSCFDQDHPQLMLGREPMDDPQALRNARPDNYVSNIQWGWAPVGGAAGDMTPNTLVATAEVGTVTITVA